MISQTSDSKFFYQSQRIVLGAILFYSVLHFTVGSRLLALSFLGCVLVTMTSFWIEALGYQLLARVMALSAACFALTLSCWLLPQPTGEEFLFACAAIVGPLILGEHRRYSLVIALVIPLIAWGLGRGLGPLPGVEEVPLSLNYMVNRKIDFVASLIISISIIRIYISRLRVVTSQGVFEAQQLQDKYLAAFRAAQNSRDELLQAEAAGRVGTWRYDRAKGESHWSPQMCRNYGLEVNEGPVPLETILSSIHPEDRPQVLAEFERALETGHEYVMRYRIEHPTLGLRWLEARGRPTPPVPNPDFVIGTTSDVTDGVLARERILEQKKQLQAFIRHAPMAVAMMDRELRYMAVSARWGEAYGRSEEELVGQNHLLHFPFDLESKRSVYKMALAGQRLREDEEFVVDRSGSSRWIRWEISPWHLSDGKIGGVILMTKDLTQEHLLRIQLETVVKSTPIVIYECLPNQNWTMTFLSPQIQELTGYPAEELLFDRSLSFSKIIHPEDQARVSDRSEKSLPRGEPYEIQYRIIHRDSSVRWVWERGILDPVTQRLNGVLWDITDQKTLERELAGSQKQIEKFFEISPEPLCILDLHLRPISLNPTFVRLLGYQKEDLVSETLLDRVIPADREKVESGLARLVSTNDPVSFELGFRSKSGQELVLFASLALDSARERIYCAISDLTEQRRSEISLIESSRLATLGEMAGGIAHEINNPLTVITGKTAVLLRQLQSAELDRSKMERDLRKIEETTLRIAKIVKGLRQFSRQVDHEPYVWTSMTQLIEDALSLCAERFRNNGTELIVDCPEDLKVKCRPVQIAQVLLNLLNNAFDATENLSERWVRVRVQPLGERVEIRVVDSGRGIPPDIAKKLMVPFFTTKEVGKGTGLGLSISAGIAQDHRGRLVYDDSGTHTQFLLDLPTDPEVSQITTARSA